ncbi:urate oxidase structural factor [Nostocoides japonicum T1-X7]|uniref:5-hydroxyisourate hydrolase n=1 Tax=Nostocoides japonicum T1-X7 TaxID=1194083 RepID=A0A077M039_9MICO|nr:hydroxyisourate hydrolase [Tetrasphaera japonica]CCH77590.1 urate oxidase structural factor [Tetrasphaera japonica T1-X7]
MSYVTAHVLDAAAGMPASGVGVRLEDASGEILATAATDADGRVADLGPDVLPPGDYRVVFATGDYFAARSTPCFHPEVAVLFRTRADQAHYHIPLLVSPFAYTTYRGS